MRLLAFLRLRDFLRSPSDIQEDPARGFPLLPCASFLVLPRYFVNLLDSTNSMNPAAAISRMMLCWNVTKVLGPNGGQNSPCPIEFSYNLWSDVAFGHWPTPNCIRARRRACLMTGRQDCLRATAQRRKYGDHAHKLAPLHSSGRLHWPSQLLWAFWIS